MLFYYCQSFWYLTSERTGVYDRDVLFFFLGCLAENNRLSKAIGVIGAYEKLMSAHRGEVECTVTSAKVLEKSEIPFVLPLAIRV